MRLALIHSAPGAAPPSAGSTAWRTCLREIHFLSNDRPLPGRHVLTGADAYALLLEVVCGLRSPLIGETEVQAQFKQFLASIDRRDNRAIFRVGQRVLADAKRIRHRHLQGFGAHSYGRLAAQHFQGDVVAVIGTGALGSQVIQSAPPTVAIDVWGRHGQPLLPAQPGGLRFTLTTDAALHNGQRTAPTTLVIAAPIAAEPLDAIVACYPSLINAVDLRPADQQTALARAVPTVVLGELLAEAAAGNLGGGARVRAARADIRDLAHVFAGREPVRSLGWDDVCA